MVEIKVTKVKCLRCGHVWIPKQSDVRRCGGCKSPYWDKPRVKK